MIQGIQTDYGGFDARFFGVMLRFSGNYPDNWNHFCQFDRAGTKERRILGDACLALDDDKAFERLAIYSVLAHELRHFHDFLLSPFANYLFRLRWLTAFNRSLLSEALFQNKAFLPYPIPFWRQMDASQREAQAELWRRMLHLQNHFEHFDLPQNDGALRMEQIERAYEEISALLLQSDERAESIRSYHIFEALAILAQVQEIYALFGRDHANRFLHTILSNHDLSMYSMVLRLLSKIWESARLFFDTRCANAVITWAMLGDLHTDGLRACPPSRFSALYRYLLENGPPPPNAPCTTLFKEWDRSLGFASVSHALQVNAKLNRDFVRKLSAKVRRNPLSSSLQSLYYRCVDAGAKMFGYPLFKIGAVLGDHLPFGGGLLCAGADVLASGSAYMARCFLHSPDRYTRPDVYRDTLPSWVAAPVLIDFSGMGMVFSKNAPRTLMMRKAKCDESGKLVVFQFYADNTVGRRLASMLAVNQIESMILMTDFEFSTFKRDDPDFDLVRQALRGGRNVTFGDFPVIRPEWKKPCRWLGSQSRYSGNIHKGIAEWPAARF
jgi:hypothetical protein